MSAFGDAGERDVFYGERRFPCELWGEGQVRV